MTTPRFKIGDYVTNGAQILFIYNINHNVYEYRIIEGPSKNYCFVMNVEAGNFYFKQSYYNTPLYRKLEGLD